jgi:hypothetical protein
MQLVPTTTGSVVPSHTVDLAGSADADFGWRPITWSADPDAPIASLTTPNGLQIETFNDAVRPQEVADVVMQGSVGSEASSVLVRLGLGSTSATATSVVNRGGVYEDFRAAVNVSYEAWLETRDSVVGHEYGHAWSWYHAYMTQRDPTMTVYLRARNLDGDPRVGSSYAWGVGELIAEDYRQLLGPAAGRSTPQANRDIPNAAEVPGLASFLSSTFTSAQPQPSPSPTPTPSPAPSPTPTPAALDVSALTVTPSTVKRSANISFVLSAPATVTIVILGNGGAIVKTILTAIGEPAGSLRFTWDRTDSNGRRVKPGAYTVKVKGQDALGNWDTAFATFPVA